MMFGASPYLITVAEMGTYSEDADRVFHPEEHERLKEYLAFRPDAGDEIAGTGGVRKLIWPFRDGEKPRESQVVYYFGGTEVPLFLLALYTEEEWVDFDDEGRNELAGLVAVLIDEQARERARLAQRPESESTA